MRKRFLTILCAGIMLVCAACGSGKTTDKTTEQAAEIVLNSGDFPLTIQIDDENMLSDTIGLNLNDIAEYTVYQQMLSVDLAELIIIKPKDGKIDAVKDSLYARKQNLIDTFAFYPNQKEPAEATVVGEKDGLCYLICCNDSAKAEEALLKEI